MFADARRLCGIGTYYEDTRMANANDGRCASYSQVDRDCWSSAYHSTAAHELVHNLGGVLESAPNATVYGHCTDEADLMCYVDGPDVKMQSVCGSARSRLLDCRHDDYFHTAPQPAATSRRAGTPRARAPRHLGVGPADRVGAGLDLDGRDRRPRHPDRHRRRGRPPTPGAPRRRPAPWPARRPRPRRCVALDRDRPGDRAGPGRGRLRARRTRRPSCNGPGRRADLPAAAPDVATEGSSVSIRATVSGKPTLGYRWSASGACTLSSTTSPAPVATCPAGSAGTGTTFGLTLTQGDGQQVVAEPVTVAVVAAPEPSRRSRSGPRRVEPPDRDGWSAARGRGSPHGRVVRRRGPGTSVDLQRRDAAAPGPRSRRDCRATPTGRWRRRCCGPVLRGTASWSPTRPDPATPPRPPRCWSASPW